MKPDAATVVSAPAAGPAGLGDEILAKARRTMAESGLDVLVAMSPENLAYISGAAPPSQRTVRSRHAAAVVPQDGATEVITVALEAPLVQSQSRLDSVTAYEEFVEDPIEVIASSLNERGLADARVGIETTYLSVADHETLTRALPRARLRPIDELLSTMRMVKTRSEIEAIRAIGAAADRIATECVAQVHAGDTERDLANLITERYLEAGGDQFTMLVVGSGPRSAHPNAPATSRTMEPGDVVRLDLIGTSRHYYSDVARTAIVGEPAGEPARIYDLLMSVHERLLAALRPGASSSAVFAIYADAMTEAGLPAYHFVGHGLGVTLHEEPFISAATAVELQEDMVLCIEPLTMLADRFGVQIEDEILITADGCEPFTRAGGLLTIPA
jgi:ectoine hydrolase